MTKYEKALEWAKLMRADQIKERQGNEDDLTAVYDTIIDALEKQTPQKIIYNTIVNEYTLDSQMFFNCPNCKRALAFTSLDFCWKCGQALDWSELDRRRTPESEVE